MLNLLERLVLRSSLLQRFVLRAHARAFARVLGTMPPPRTVAIVGGGLFPRTALILRELLPHAQLTVVDANRAHLNRARDFLADSRIRFVEARYPAAPGIDDPEIANQSELPPSLAGSCRELRRG